MEEKRGSFGSNFGFLMAAIGSAVGLGNIWGFPYKMGMNGGFAFLLVYLLLAIFIGLAVMLGELAIGRKTGLSPVEAYKTFAKKHAWLGFIGVASGFLILCFYLVLGGMVTRYALGYLTALFGWNTWGLEGADIGKFFEHFICNSPMMMLYFVIFALANAFIVAAGVGEGLEKFCKIGMPALFVILLVVLIYVAIQPGAGDGYKFMFGLENAGLLKTDFFGVLKVAAGQMFFSLSLGMGAMITYGSYLNKKEDLQKNAGIIVFCDTLIAVMAGMVVMPACYAFGVEPTKGPGLLFNAMQVVFYNMGGFIGNLMGFLFYALVFIAAISSSISLLECCASYKIDKNIAKGKAPGRKKTAYVYTLIILVLGSTVAFDGLGSGRAEGALLDPPARLFGFEYAEAGDIDGFAEDTAYYVLDGESYVQVAEDAEFDANATYYINNVKTWSADWLDFFDMLSEGILMPLGALVMSILIGWVWKIDVVKNEIAESGHKMWGRGFFNLCYKFITPVGLVFVLLAQLNDFFNLGIFH